MASSGEQLLLLQWGFVALDTEGYIIVKKKLFFPPLWTGQKTDVERDVRGGGQHGSPGFFCYRCLSKGAGPVHRCTQILQGDLLAPKTFKQKTRQHVPNTD